MRARRDSSLLPVFKDEVPGYTPYGPLSPPKKARSFKPVLRKRTRNLGIYCFFVCVLIGAMGVGAVWVGAFWGRFEAETVWLGVSALAIACSYIPLGISLLGLYRRLDRRSWRQFRMWVWACGIVPLVCAVVMWFVQDDVRFAPLVAEFAFVPFLPAGFVRGFVVWVDPLSPAAVASDEYVGPAGGPASAPAVPVSGSVASSARADRSVPEGGER